MKLVPPVILSFLFLVSTTLLMAQEEHGKKFASYFFLLNLDGNLQKSCVVYGEKDNSGGTIKGSGRIEVLDIKSRSTRKRFQHELDFWLKGMYRIKS